MAHSTSKEYENPHAQQLLAELGGAKSIDVVGLLRKHKEVDEFKLADRLKMDVKSVRKILYRLYEKKLVSFRRMRDETRGWHIYIWRIEPGRMAKLMTERREKSIDQLKGQMDYEKTNQFFKCENGCVRVVFEKAFENSFVCSECNGKLVFFDNASIIKQLREYITQKDTIIGG
jgi:transcription initiation factor TFIIE subunit alpha